MELWDLFDHNRAPLGVTHPRGRQYPMPAGTYHTVVTIFTVSADGRLLLTRRAPEKNMYPGYPEVTGGSAVAGEDSLTAARRELAEETGLEGVTLDRIATVRVPAAFVDIYLARLDKAAVEVPVTLQVGETTEAFWVDFWTFEAMIQRGEIPPPIAMRYGAIVSRLREILGGDLWPEPGVIAPQRAPLNAEVDHG